jgi:hypothetical protein
VAAINEDGSEYDLEDKMTGRVSATLAPFNPASPASPDHWGMGQSSAGSGSEQPESGHNLNKFSKCESLKDLKINRKEL